MSTTSELRISVLVRDVELDRAVQALHAAFDPARAEQAVVYAASGI
jgi:aspartate kinase